MLKLNTDESLFEKRNEIVFIMNDPVCAKMIMFTVKLDPKSFLVTMLETVYVGD